MTSAFDGMGASLAGALGEPVTITPSGGGSYVVRGLVRNRDVEVADENDEPVVATMTTLRVPASQATTLAPGDRVTASAGTFIVRHSYPARGVAPDGLRQFILEEDMT